MINSTDKEDPKKKSFRILGEATGHYRGRLRMLCADSKELNEALYHVDEAVHYAMKAIEIALEAKEKEE